MSEHDPLVAAESIALIALGGFAGANVRYVVDTLLPSLPATLAVNVAGSALLGFVLYEEAYVGAFSRQLRFALGTGFLSSLTTYSTFAVQTAGATPAVAMANVAANYVLGFAGVAVGRSVALAVRRRVQ